MRNLWYLAGLAIISAGCSSASAQSTPADPSWDSPYSRWGKDPVGVELILKRTSADERRYQGMTYYFRCIANANEFDSDPAYFAKQANIITAPPHQQNSKVR